MRDDSSSQTSITLLERLARAGTLDQAAWSEFVERYGRKVYLWCLRWRLQDADAQDVTQIVLLKLAARMRTFQYDPARSFRAWLKTVAYHAWRDLVDGQHHGAANQGGAAGRATLETAEAREDLARGLEEQYERELLEQAMEAVRPRVAAHNWRAFCLTALEGEKPADVARQLDMKIARVYAARSTVQQMLQEECRRLEGEQGPP